jgi:hypothetical protein
MIVSKSDLAAFLNKQAGGDNTGVEGENEEDKDNSKSTNEIDEEIL